MISFNRILIYVSVCQSVFVNMTDECNHQSLCNAFCGALELSSLVYFSKRVSLLKSFVDFMPFGYFYIFVIECRGIYIYVWLFEFREKSVIGLVAVLGSFFVRFCLLFLAKKTLYHLLFNNNVCLFITLALNNRLWATLRIALYRLYRSYLVMVFIKLWIALRSYKNGLFVLLPVVVAY